MVLLLPISAVVKMRWSEELGEEIIREECTDDDVSMLYSLMRTVSLQRSTQQAPPAKRGLLGDRPSGHRTQKNRCVVVLHVFVLLLSRGILQNVFA